MRTADGLLGPEGSVCVRSVTCVCDVSVCVRKCSCVKGWYGVCMCMREGVVWCVCEGVDTVIATFVASKSEVYPKCHKLHPVVSYLTWSITLSNSCDCSGIGR